jgi:hypothetical protein
MKRCPKCENPWDDNKRYCPFHGLLLIPVAPAAEDRPPAATGKLSTQERRDLSGHSESKRPLPANIFYGRSEAAAARPSSADALETARASVRARLEDDTPTIRSKRPQQWPPADAVPTNTGETPNPAAAPSAPLVQKNVDTGEIVVFSRSEQIRRAELNPAAASASAWSPEDARATSESLPHGAAAALGPDDERSTQAFLHRKRVIEQFVDGLVRQGFSAVRRSAAYDDGLVEQFDIGFQHRGQSQTYPISALLQRKPLSSVSVSIDLYDIGNSPALRTQRTEAVGGRIAHTPSGVVYYLPCPDHVPDDKLVQWLDESYRAIFRIAYGGGQS